MDRRQRKTRDAIFSAFTELLSRKNYNQISVQEIIDTANIGRTTFYAHFETKDDLTQALCRDLFCHIFDGTGENDHKHLFSCDPPKSILVHLCRHLQNNDHQILNLLVRQNNGVFQLFIALLRKDAVVMDSPCGGTMPEDLWLAYLADGFLTTICWWYSSRMQMSAEDIAGCFAAAFGLGIIPVCNR